MKKIFTILSLTLMLQGCFFVAGAAAGAAAIAVVYDHRTLSKTVEDTKISNKIANKMKSIPALSQDSHIEVTVFNYIVLLTGETPNEASKERAGQLAENTADVKKVYNQITIQGPTSSLTRTSDSWITTKIKSQMLATDDLKSSSIKVVTENGVVYLMGIVNRAQADIAVDIARNISGVQKVMKIFTYTAK
jgi:osmotically-inducible protein OsmY